jgi:hypothetical protein
MKSGQDGERKSKTSVRSINGSIRIVVDDKRVGKFRMTRR